MTKLDGHRAGIKNALDIVSSARGLGIKQMTFYVFSSENWYRPMEEVNGLMSLFEYYLTAKSAELARKNIKVQFIGNFAKVPKKLKECMSKVEAESKDSTGLQLYIALSYGGRAEILNAAKKLAVNYKKGACNLDDVDEDYFKSLLYVNITYPDLLIRTGGDMRISNFLIWQIAYTELYFTKTYWPDFKEAELKNALDSFHNRERRYGK